MAYISTETVKEIRNQIKINFPTKKGWKFSVTCRDYSQVHVAVMRAPIDFLENTERDHLQMVQYHTDSFAAEQWKVIEKLYSIAKTEDYFDKSDSQTDYFHCSHYIDISIGKWDKQFELVA
jgi:hypothetical protein